MKDNCEQIMLELSDHYDEGSPINAKLRLHISQCDECEHFHRQWGNEGKLAGISAIRQEASVPQNLTDSILDQISTRETAPQPSSRSNILKIWIPLAAAACFGIAFLLQPSPPQTYHTASIAQQPTPGTDLDQMNNVLQNINKNKVHVSNSLLQLGESSSQVINGGGKQMSRLASGIEYISTNLSKLVPTIPGPSPKETYIPGFNLNV